MVVEKTPTKEARGEGFKEIIENLNPAWLDRFVPG